MGTRSALTLALIIFAAAQVVAQGDVGVEPLVGLYRANDADGFRVIGGAAVRFRLSGMFAIEGSINYREEEYGNGSVNVKSWPVMVSGLLYPFPAVYGAVGAGWYHTGVSYNVPPGLSGGLTAIPGETKQQFGWQVGGGVELPVFSFVKLVGDIRYVFLNYSFKSLPGSSVVNGSSPVMTAGLLFRL